MSSELLLSLLSGTLPLDFNWNSEPHTYSVIPKHMPPEPTHSQITAVEIVSEDLRDGLHGISHYPVIGDLLEYVGVLYRLGIRSMTVGIYPGEGNKINATIQALLSTMAVDFPQVTPIVLAPANEKALEWLAECKRLNRKLHGLIFMGTAPSRLLVEEWQKEYVLKKLAWAIKTAVNVYDIDVIGATEHTTQTPPDFLRDIIRTAVENGAQYFCIADTIGLARPVGTARIIHFVKKVLKDLNAKHVKIDWHGHNDLGNGTANAMVAIAAGADRVHTVARGIGERAGNTNMEAVILNCAEILGEADKKLPWDISVLSEVLSVYDRITATPPPSHGPLSTRAFRTSLGIHTAAMLKAELVAIEAKKERKDKLAVHLQKMARKIYSALDPNTIGRNHEIHVGPWSGKSTVKLVYLQQGHDPETLTEELTELVLTTAKKLGRELTVEELRKLLHNNHT